MIYKSFRINCIARIFLIAANLYLFFYLFINTQYYATTIITGLLPIFQVWAFFYYVSKTNRFLEKAFESIQYDNFSEQINTPLTDASFKELCGALNRIIEKFQKNRLEKEQQFQYLKAIVHQTGMGLISIRPKGEINLINKAARVMLKIPHFNHIRQFETVNKTFLNLLIEMKTGEKKFLIIVTMVLRFKLLSMPRISSLRMNITNYLPFRIFKKSLKKKKWMPGKNSSAY